MLVDIAFARFFYYPGTIAFYFIYSFRLSTAVRRVNAQRLAAFAVITGYQGIFQIVVSISSIGCTTVYASELSPIERVVVWFRLFHWPVYSSFLSLQKRAGQSKTRAASTRTTINVFSSFLNLYAFRFRGRQELYWNNPAGFKAANLFYFLTYQR